MPPDALTPRRPPTVSAISRTARARPAARMEAGGGLHEVGPGLLAGPAGGHDAVVVEHGRLDDHLQHGGAVDSLRTSAMSCSTAPSRRRAPGRGRSPCRPPWHPRPPRPMPRPPSRGGGGRRTGNRRRRRRRCAGRAGPAAAGAGGHADGLHAQGVGLRAQRHDVRRGRLRPQRGVVDVGGERGAIHGCNDARRGCDRRRPPPRGRAAGPPRDETTDRAAFRQAMDELAGMLVYRRARARLRRGPRSGRRSARRPSDGWRRGRSWCRSSAPASG